MNTKNTSAKCLICEKPASVRGLCRSHYETYRKTREMASDKDAYEQNAVDRGLIAAEDKRKAKNPFAELLQEMQHDIDLAELKSEQAAQQAKKAARVAKESAAESAKKKKSAE